MSDRVDVTRPPAAVRRSPYAPSPQRRRQQIRRRRIVVGLGAVFTVALVLIAIVVGDLLYLNSEIHRVKVGGLNRGSLVGAEAGTENILLVGSTSRCALKVQNPTFGLCSQGVSGVNSDVVMILHLNPATRQVSLLSIPRDTFIPNARTEGANKIDAALAEGPTQLVAAVQEDFGIPIQHYVELNFDTFAGVVDALGGVYMYFPEPVFDAYSGLDVTQTGCRKLNGTQALAVVRARHLQYRGADTTSSNPSTWPQEGESDLARIRRDHEFLRVLTTAVAARGLGNPLTDQQLAGAVAPQLQVDSKLSGTDLADLLLTYRHVNPAGSPQLTAPIITTTFGSYVYKGGNYGDIVWPAQPQDGLTIDTFLGVSGHVDTLTGAQLPAPHTVTVSVLNGSATANQAKTTAKALTADGFKVGHIGTTPEVATHTETVVYYTAGHAAAAEAVMHTLDGPAVLGRDDAMTTPGFEVTVDTGTELYVTPTAGSPSAAHPTTAPPPAAASTAAASIAGTLPPSNANEGLMPWDPRSCTPNGGEGP